MSLSYSQAVLSLSCTFSAVMRGPSLEVFILGYNHTGEQSRIHLIMNWIVDIVVMIVLACYTVYAFGGRVAVAGHSMEPVLSSEEIVLMNRLAYDLKSPARLDIAVIDRGPAGLSVKRIIGLPGETVQIKDGRIYINEKLLEAEGDLASVSIAGIAEYPVELGEDEYFLLGDNRDSSEDSRFTSVGNVKREQLLGKVWLRFQPLSEFGLIHS